MRPFFWIDIIYNKLYIQNARSNTGNAGMPPTLKNLTIYYLLFYIPIHETNHDQPAIEKISRFLGKFPPSPQRDYAPWWWTSVHIRMCLLFHDLKHFVVINSEIIIILSNLIFISISTSAVAAFTFVCFIQNPKLIIAKWWSGSFVKLNGTISIFLFDTT